MNRAVRVLGWDDRMFYKGLHELRWVQFRLDTLTAAGSAIFDR